MDKKQSPNDSDGLEAAIRKAEAETENATKWLQSEVSGATRSTVSSGGGKESTRRSSGSGAFDSGPEILNVVTRISGDIVDGGITTRRQLRIGIIGLFVAVLALIATVVIGTISINKSTQRAEDRYAQSQLSITFPSHGASVGLGQKVRGTSPHPERNHYLLITNVRTGSVRVEPVRVSADGLFTADAKFDDGGGITAGEDDEFTLRLLMTESRMDLGALAGVPADAIRSEPVTVRRTLLTPQITISAPTNGSDVGLATSVSGKSSAPDLNHYIVVKSVKVGTSYVQDRPASVNRVDGTFSGNARIGGVAVGIDEQFEIRVIATKSTLPAAPLTNEPADSISSNSVTVTRKQ